MNDWSKDIDLEVIKEYLQECAENDDYHYEQYQVDIIMHEYIRQKQIIERLNNIINEFERILQQDLENEKDTYWTNITTEDYIQFMLNKLQELKGSDKE